MNKSNQAARSPALLMALLLLAAAPLFFLNSASYTEAARVFKVGDSFGWQQPTTNATISQFNYTQWATGYRFQVGDSLLFEYEKDSVAEVDEWGYSNCNTSTSMAVFDNGNSSFKLQKPGASYFISGSFGHCKNGQRLLVEVLHSHHHYQSIAPSPGYANPPEGYSSSPYPSPSSSMEPPSSPATDQYQPSSAVIATVTVSSVALVLIATFGALAWFSP